MDMQAAQTIWVVLGCRPLTIAEQTLGSMLTSWRRQNRYCLAKYDWGFCECRMQDNNTVRLEDPGKLMEGMHCHSAPGC